MTRDHSFLDEPRLIGRVLRRMMRATPSAPRCKVCFAPFAGIGARVVRLAGFTPSRKNPKFCKWCFESAPLGGVEMEVGVMFADMRGFTTRSESMAPAEAAALANRFYSEAAEVLVRHVAVIDKMEGDAVMALFLPSFLGGDYVATMVRAAEDLLQAVGPDDGEAWCPLGIGIDAGMAFVGNVGAGEVKDFTAIGDVVNTAARLQSEAHAGQIVLSAGAFEHVRAKYPRAAAVELELRGKAEPVQAYVIEPAAKREPAGTTPA
jgi:adenylate cyclase